jgi:heme-degrading monooxygenase HmoA
MLLRIWRTGVDTHRWAEYARFEREHSLPMFRAQPGCRGVLFTRSPDGSGAAACSFWDDQTAIDRLATSAMYQATVARLMATGLLSGTQSVEVFEIAAGALDQLDGERFREAQ